MDDPINCNKFWDAARVNIFGIGLCTEHTHTCFTQRPIAHHDSRTQGKAPKPEKADPPAPGLPPACPACLASGRSTGLPP